MRSRILPWVLSSAAAISLFTGNVAAQVVPVSIFGSDHIPVGNATLQISRDHLFVGNIGSSGQDGVAVDLGEAQGAALSIVNRGAATTDLLGVSATLKGTVRGNPGVDLGGIQLLKSGSAAELFGNFPLPSNNSMIEVTIVGDDGPMTFPAVPEGALGLMDFGLGGLPQDFAILAQSTSGTDGDEPLPVLMVIANQDFYYQDYGSGGNAIGRVGYIRRVAPDTIDPASALSLVVSGAAAAGNVAIPEVDDEVLVAFAHGARAMGGATLDVTRDGLVLGNIGSSGDDGIQIPLGPLGADDLIGQLLEAQDVATGLASGKRQHKPVQVSHEWGASSPQIMQAICTNESLIHGALGPSSYRATVESPGDDTMTLQTDFSEIGSGDYEIEISQNGKTVATGEGDPDLPIIIGGVPTALPVRAVTLTIDETEFSFLLERAARVGYSATLDPVELDPDLPVLITMRALELKGLPLGKNSVEFHYYNNNDVTVTNIESLDTGFLPGDYNEDGVVDAADFTRWRDLLGLAVSLPNETETPGMVTEEDYDAWVDNFGNTLDAGSTLLAAVPEPPTFVLLFIAITIPTLGQRRRAVR